MSNLIIKNGIVFDPINNISGEKKDILIEAGKIVDKFKHTNSKDVRSIDASGKTVIPGAIDIHTHIASQQTNNIRLLGSKNKEFQQFWNGLTLDYLTKEYVSKGYTFIVEANVFPSLAKQTIFNFDQIPILDKAMLINASNLWSLELEYQKGDIEKLSVFISDLLDLIKGFGLKIYNPFEAEEWALKEIRDDITTNGRLYNFNALDVFRNMTKTIEQIELPHSIHAHIDGYESEIGELNAIKVLEDIKTQGLTPSQSSQAKIKRSQIFHLAHASAYSFNDDTKLINFFNSNDNFDLDLGFISFNPINPLITSDRRLINKYLDKKKTPKKYPIIKGAIESEGDHFETFRTLKKDNSEYCMLWSNALNLALRIKDKWKLQFSINFPNYAHLTDIPEIISWLLNKNSRNTFMENMNNEFKQDNPLFSIEDTFSINDLIIITRASPAKSLGLGDIKGNLGIGADADINMLNLNLQEIDYASQIDEIKKAFSDIDTVIKNGIIVKQGEKINLNHKGALYWSKGTVNTQNYEKIMDKKKEFYKKYSSIFYESLKPNTDKIKLIKI